MLVLDLVQTSAVVVGVAYGAYQVDDLRRTRQATSMDSLLSEWRRCSDERAALIKGLPAFDGPPGAQVSAFIDWMHEQPEDRVAELTAVARKTVNSLTDLGAYLESGAMSKNYSMDKLARTF